MIMIKTKIRFLLICSLLLLQIVISSKANFERSILNKFMNGDKKTLFKVYHYVYKKDYDLNSEEGVRRYRIFKQNLAYIEEENKKGHTYTLGLTDFVDYSIDELNKMFLREDVEAAWNALAEEVKYERNIKINYNNFFDSSYDDDIETSENTYNQIKRTPIDWRHLYLPVRSQGKCGSCWTFAVAGTLEGNYALKFPQNDKYYLSTQQMLDCDSSQRGCGGGWTHGVLNNYTKKVGLVPDSAYPYISGPTEVNYNCKLDVVNSPDVTRVKNRGSNYCGDCAIDTWYNYLSRGPISISSFVTSNWYFYTGGIYSIKACNTDKTNHAIVAVGWGVETNPDGSVTEYFIIRNSWGEKWGEAGYARFKYQPEFKKSCFMNARASSPFF